MYVNGLIFVVWVWYNVLNKLEFDGEVKQNVNDGTNRRNDCRMETNF